MPLADQHQVVHRNITPVNLLIRRDGDIAKRNDLILACAIARVLNRQVTTPGELLGDLRFAPPGADRR